MEILKTAEILRVCIYNDQAIVIAKLGGENTRNPYDVRSLQKVGDQWHNKGNERFDSEDAARSHCQICPECAKSGVNGELKNVAAAVPSSVCGDSRQGTFLLCQCGVPHGAARRSVAYHLLSSLDDTPSPPFTVWTFR